MTDIYFKIIILNIEKHFFLKLFGIGKEKKEETVMFSYLEYICPRENIDVISTFSFILYAVYFLRHILA